MNLKRKVEEALGKINPKLEELAEGTVELIEVDEREGFVKLRLRGGSLC
jgi:Fe-S cluster biogenesis protein NfuA